MAGVEAGPSRSRALRSAAASSSPGLLHLKLALQPCVPLLQLSELRSEIAGPRVDIQRRQGVAQRGGTPAVICGQCRHKAQARRACHSLFPGARGSADQRVALLVEEHDGGDVHQRP
ncbi:hypothetical protein [Azohydromonas lata]|uniref:Uncharacterized protein n=1 Tax=Azohydromonas lata TaxID=45677 RepID=A0ABU5I8R4_9BURK|nr:hypothetical protein [Azohydromonas lata]MDZ5455348.1 hypothetical protein [Azohydromonas lata]